MRIACLQFAPQVGDVDNNLNRADAVLSRANPKDLDLLVLPELCFSGYNFSSLQHITPYLEPTAAGITSLWARTTALKHNCIVTAGYPEKVDVRAKWPSGPEYYNSAITVNPDGETIANYRKSFLYYTDETWALEGSGFYNGQIEGLGNVAMGICMDLNPYKFEAPWDAWEFSYHVLYKKANLVIMSMAWLTREDITAYSRAPHEPDMDTLSYWLSRLEPLIRAETVGEIIVVLANRCGVEDDVIYAGTSTVLGIHDGEVKVYGILGRGEKELLVVDTNERPKAKLISEPTSATSTATDNTAVSRESGVSASTAYTSPDEDGVPDYPEDYNSVSSRDAKYPHEIPSSSDDESFYRETPNPRHKPLFSDSPSPRFPVENSMPNSPSNPPSPHTRGRRRSRSIAEPAIAPQPMLQETLVNSPTLGSSCYVAPAKKSSSLSPREEQPLLSPSRGKSRGPSDLEIAKPPHTTTQEAYVPSPTLSSARYTPPIKQTSSTSPKQSRPTSRHSRMRSRPPAPLEPVPVLSSHTANLDYHGPSPTLSSSRYTPTPVKSTPSPVPSITEVPPTPQLRGRPLNREEQDRSLISRDSTQGSGSQYSINSSIVTPPPIASSPDHYQSEFTSKTLGTRREHVSPRPRSAYW